MLNPLDAQTRAEFQNADLEEACEPIFIASRGDVLWRHPDGRGWIRWDLGLARSVLAQKLAEPRAWETTHRAELSAAIAEAAEYHKEHA